MFRRIWILAATLGLFSFSANPQEHAPLKEQCRADVSLWDDAQNETTYTDYLTSRTKSLQTNEPNHSTLNLLSMTEIDKRGHEMAECMNVDPEQSWFNRYHESLLFFNGIREDRMIDFLGPVLLYESWGLLALCVVITVFSFRLSAAAHEKQLDFLHKFYIDKNEGFFNKRSAYHHLLSIFNWAAAILFLFGLLTMMSFLFVNRSA